MDLPRASQEYSYITLANEPNVSDVVEASVDSGKTWTTISVTGTAAEVLLRGPDYTDDTLGMLVSENATALWIRDKSNPEAVARVAAVVFLY